MPYRHTQLIIGKKYGQEHTGIHEIKESTPPKTVILLYLKLSESLK